jgi:hypothetical protein
MTAEKWKVCPKPSFTATPGGTRFRKVVRAKTKTAEDVAKTFENCTRSPHSAHRPENMMWETLARKWKAGSGTGMEHNS